MQVAIIALQGNFSPQTDEDWLKSEELEADQALALASYMNNGDKLTPLLICNARSELERKAGEKNLPCLAIGSLINPWYLWRLWRWQRQYSNLTVLVIGQSGVGLGRRLWQIHGRQRTRIYFSYFLKTPIVEKKTTFLDGSTGCFCGSQIIRAKMEKIVPLVDFYKIVPPGIDLENYQDHSARLVPFSEKHHFVFGMTESLLPNSGALSVIRAMAAIWQAEGLPPWEVRMFGSGPRFEEILTEAEKLGVASRLSLLGNQLLSQAASLCDVWLAPGDREYELPQDLWAGFAAGLPVICSQTPLHKERLEIPGCALKVNHHNPQELARAMIAIMRDERLRNRLIASSAQMRPLVGNECMAARMCAYLEKFTDRKPKKRRGIR